MTDVKITCEAGGIGHWLALDDVDIDLPPAGRTFSLATGVYYLAWWIVGAPGDAMKIKASVNGESITEVDTQIPAGEDKAAGVLKLEVE